MLTNTGKSGTLEIGKKSIEIIEEIVYLGSIISFSCETELEVRRRVALAWNKYWALGKIFKGTFNNNVKSAIFNSCIAPIMTYGAQTWAMTKREENKIRVTQNSLERSMLKSKLRNKIELTKIKNIFRKNFDILKVAKLKKWNWGGHVARLDNKKWANKVTFWQNLEKRKRGKQKTKWRDGFRKLLGHDLFHSLAQDRKEWARLGEAFALL